MAAELAIIAKLQDDASSGIRSLRGEVEGLGDSGGIAAKGFQTLQSVGTASIVAIGVAVAAATAAAVSFVKSAIDAGIEFESAFAGVVKTVDGVADASGALTELGQQLRDEFRQLALEIPIAVTELARIGELGGQLGVASGDLIAFTELIAKLGVTTNLSTEEAAMSFAQLGNIMQSSQDDLTRLGSSIVWLGNNFATTEAEIVEFTSRIAGAGAIANMSEADLAGIAAAFASVGVSAEAGGTAVQKVILDMNTAVVSGGAQLELYARTAGMTAQEFAQAWREDAAGAFIAFVEGLGRAGDQAILILKELGLTDARLTRGFLSVANAGELLREAVEGSNQAFRENMALVREAALRFQTVESQMQLFRNVINDVKISLYDALRPAIGAIIAALTLFLTSVAPQVREVFQAIGGAVNELVTALLKGESPVLALVDALYMLGAGLGMPIERLEAIRQGVLNFISGVSRVLGPIAQAITSFFSWKDVLVALGVAIASVVIPALIAIVQFAAPIVAVFGGLVLAIAAVRNAWEADFLGIRTAVEGFVQNVLKLIETLRATNLDDFSRLFNELPPLFQEAARALVNLKDALRIALDGIRALLSGDTATAMEAFRSAWEKGWTAIVGFVQNAGAQIGQALQGLWQGIVAWFQSVDWGGLARDLIERFLSGMAALGQARADLWAWILTALTNFINSVDWAQIGYSLVDLLGKGILGAVGLIATAVAGIVTFIWNFITGTNWIELGINLVNAVIDGLGSFASGVGAKLAEWRQAIFDWAGAEDWSGVAEKISTMVGEKLGEMRDAISGKLNEWQTAIFDWAGAEDWSGVAAHIAENIGEKLGEAGDAISGKLNEWQAAIFDWAGAEDWQGVADHIAENIGEKLGEAGSSVTATLSNWQRAIFDWAGAEDWNGVATHIAELVGSALGDAAGSIVSTLDSWEQAIFDWAGGADWGDVSESIATLVGDSLGETSDKVTGKLSSWITAFTDWVNTVDWYQVGYDIMYKITDAFLDFKTAVTVKIAGWLTDVKTETEGYAWYEVGAYILLKIAESAAGAVTDWVQAVSAWVGNIGSAITQHLGNLAQVGRDIVAGIAAGISAAGDLIQGAIAGVAAGSEPAARQAVGAQSPARKLIPVGMDISAGIAVGITQGAGAIISAIHTVADATQMESAKAFGEAMAAVAKGIASALSAALDVGSFSGLGSGFGAAMQQIAAAMAVMVGAVASANTYSQEALEELSAFLEVVGEIGAVLNSVRDATGVVMNFQPPPLNIVTLAFERMAGYLAVMLTVLNGLTLETIGVVSELGDFIDVATELGTLMVSIHSAVGAAMNWQPPPLNIVATAVGVMAQHLAAVMTAFFEANRFGLGGLAILTEFAGTAAAIAEMVGPAVGAMHDLNAFGSVQLDRFHEGVAQLAYTLQIVMQAFNQANTFGSLVLGQISDFADTAGGIAEMVGPAILAMHELDAFGAVRLDTFHEGIAQLAYTLQIVLQNFVRVNTFGSAVLGLAREFAEAAGAVVDVIAPAIEGMDELNAFGAVRLDRFHEGVAQLAYTLQVLVGAFVRANNFGSAMLAQARDFAETAGEIIDVVGEAIEVMGLLSGYASSTQQLGAVIQAFAADLLVLLNTLVGAFAAAAAAAGGAVATAAEFAGHAEDIIDVVEPGIEALLAIAGFEAVAGIRVAAMAFANQLVAVLAELASAFSQAAASAAEAIEEAAEFAGHAEDILDVVEPGIEALAAIAGFEAVAAIRVSAMAFANQLVAVLAELASAFSQAAASAAEAIEEAAEFAGHAEDILDVVVPGIEALAAVAVYVPASGIGAAVQTFAADLIAVILALTNAFQQAGILANQAVVEAGEMSGALEDIVSVVEPAVEAVVALVGYTTVGGLQANARQFAADLVIVVQTLVDGLSQAGLLANQAVAEAGEMAKSIEDILKVVEPALHPDKGALSLIAKYVSQGGLVQKAQQFTTDLINVTQILVTGLTTSALAAGVALTKAGEMAKSIESLFDALDPAMTAIGKLADYASAANLQQKTQQFTADLVAVATILVAGLTQAANQLGAEAVSAAHAFAQAVSLMVSRVQAVVEALAQFGGMATPNIEPILTYIVASAQQITGAFAQAGDIGAAVQYAESFRLNLLQLVNEVKAAVAYLIALAGTGVSGSVGAALAAIAASLQNTEGQFAGAGAKLATALIDALRGGIDGGEGAVVQALAGVLAALEGAGMAEARDFDNVGAAIDDAMVDGVKAGQSQVMAAVVQVVAAAVAAGLSEAKKAAAIGEEMIRAVLAEVGTGRSQLDQAGVAAGAALIDGMVRAITLGKSRLVNAIKDAVNSAVAAAKAALGIASPSRVAFELIDNFMRTAAGRFGDASGLVTAVGRSIDATMTAAMKRLEQVRLDVPVVATGRDITRTLVPPPVVHSRPSAGALAFDGAGRGGTVNVYGNIVLPNVSNPVSFLEELDALRGGG